MHFSNEEDTISRMAQKVFLLDLVLIRKISLWLKCGKHVAVILNALCSQHLQKVLAGYSLSFA